MSFEEDLQELERLGKRLKFWMWVLVGGLVGMALSWWLRF